MSFNFEIGRTVREVSSRKVNIYPLLELRRRRKVEERLELGHCMDLTTALEDVDAFLGSDDRVAVEVGLLKRAREAGAMQA